MAGGSAPEKEPVGSDVMPDYEKMRDEELALSAVSDPIAGETLLMRYKDFVKKIVRPYFIIGADREDLIQEGMIGLCRAIQGYLPDKDASFASFAAICIRNQIMTAIKSAARKKHSPLNTYISIDDESPTVSYIIDHSHNPEKLIIYRESKRCIENAVNTALSSLESAILLHFLAGLTYAEIGEKLGRSPKSVDNALFRIRRKVAKFTDD